MAIRKPGLSVTEARRLAAIRTAASQQMAQLSEHETVATPSPSPPAQTVILEKLPEAKPVKPLTDVASRARPTMPKTPPTRTGPAVSAPAAASHAIRNPPKKVQVFISALLPASTVSPVFDILSRQYPSQKALQMILRRAMDDYEDTLRDGTFHKSPVTYAADESGTNATLIQTSRMMSKDLLTVARAHFDPLGLESTRAFGFKLATAALAAFFAREIKIS